jgi:hypothetical protein
MRIIMGAVGSLPAMVALIAAIMLFQHVHEAGVEQHEMFCKMAADDIEWELVLTPTPAA